MTEKNRLSLGNESGDGIILEIIRLAAILCAAAIF